MRDEVLTARLRLRRPVVGEDEERYRRLFADPVVREWLWPPPLEPPGTTEADAALARDAARWAGDGFGPWLLFARDGGDFVGRVGLARADLAGEAVVEVGLGRPERAPGRRAGHGGGRWPPSTPPASSGSPRSSPSPWPRTSPPAGSWSARASRSTGRSSTPACPTCSTAARPERGRRSAARRAARSRSGAGCAAATRAAGGGRRGSRRRAPRRAPASARSAARA